MSERAKMYRRGRLWPLIVLVLGIAGGGVSTFSTIDHIGFRNPEDRNPGFCSAIAESGCAAAHTSPAAEILGVPISHVGTGFYATTALLALLFLLGRARPGGRFEWFRGGIPAALLLPALASLPYSVYLASILYSAGEACPLCIALYAVNVGLAGACLVWSWPGIRSLSEVKVRAFAALVGVGVLMGVVMATTTPFVVLAMQGDPIVADDLFVDSGAAGREFSAAPAWAPTWGSEIAPTKVIEVSNFECSRCARVHRSVDEVLRGLGSERLQVSFISFPMDPSCNPHVSGDGQSNACLAAKAGLCAHAQGRFRDFAMGVFTFGARRSRDGYLELASSLGLLVDEFKRCLDSRETEAELARHIEWAYAAGVRRPPALLVDETRIDGELTPELLKQAVTQISPCGCDLKTPEGAFCGPP